MFREFAQKTTGKWTGTCQKEVVFDRLHNTTNFLSDDGRKCNSEKDNKRKHKPVSKTDSSFHSDCVKTPFFAETFDTLKDFSQTGSFVFGGSYMNISFSRKRSKNPKKTPRIGYFCKRRKFLICSRSKVKRWF